MGEIFTRVYYKNGRKLDYWREIRGSWQDKVRQLLADGFNVVSVTTSAFETIWKKGRKIA